MKKISYKVDVGSKKEKEKRFLLLPNLTARVAKIFYYLVLL